jgi:hypothetical protein
MLTRKIRTTYLEKLKHATELSKTCFSSFGCAKPMRVPGGKTGEKTFHSQ